MIGVWLPGKYTQQVWEKKSRGERRRLRGEKRRGEKDRSNLCLFHFTFCLFFFFLLTELTYCRSLDIISKLFIDPLRTKKSPHYALLSDEDIKVIFPVIDELKSFHKIMLGGMWEKRERDERRERRCERRRGRNGRREIEEKEKEEDERREREEKAGEMKERRREWGGDTDTPPHTTHNHTELEQRVRKWSDTQLIGDVFLKYSPFFKVTKKTKTIQTNNQTCHVSRYDTLRCDTWHELWKNWHNCGDTPTSKNRSTASIAKITTSRMRSC